MAWSRLHHSVFRRSGFRFAVENASKQKSRSARMPIYELDGVKPEFPGEGTYWIAETAVLIGRVRLKRDTSVWFGAVLRGDNEWIELGERPQIPDNSRLHNASG